MRVPGLSNKATKPTNVVSRMFAVQAQEPASVRWALGLRCGRKEKTIRRALDDGTLIRTHGFRGTWQVLDAKDVRTMLTLVLPGFMKRHQRRFNELGLDEQTLKRVSATLSCALEKDELTRDEIRALLERKGFEPVGGRFSYMLHHAEVAGVVCSGRFDGNQQRYAPFEKRIPTSSRVSFDDALADVAARFRKTRPAATEQDFVWWTGLPAKTAREYFHAAAAVDDAEDDRGVRLLPAFDEFLLSFKDRTHVLDPAYNKVVNAGGGMIKPIVVTGGRVAGVWKLPAKADTLTVRFFRPLERRRHTELESQVEAYASFLGRALDLEVQALS